MEVNSESIIAGATVVQVFITGVLVFITAYYARTTRKILEQNQLIRVDAQKPEIALYPAEYSLDPSCVGLVLENIGAGPALDVDFTYNPSFKINNNETLESVRVLHGLDYLPPKYNSKNQLCTRFDDYFFTLMKKQLSVGVTYKDSMHNEYKDSFPINFNKSLRLKGEI